MDIATRAGAASAETVTALYCPPDGAPRVVEDALAVEGPLQIRLDGAPWSVTLRTPGDDRDLVLGLLFSEGVLEVPEDVLDCEERISSVDGIADAVHLRLRPGAGSAKNPSARRLASNSSCGACGTVDAGDLPAITRRKPGGRAFDLSTLPALEGRLRAAQALFARTGGTHAAAVFDADGELLVLKEDVGRHNAVDKAVGFLWGQGRLGKSRVLFVSGRVSYEIVAKASRAGIAALLAVSAPSTLAVKLCAEAGIVLAGFCRGGKATVYTHADRVVTAGVGEGQPGVGDIAGSAGVRSTGATL
jgi:FdhD protein